MEDDMAVNTVKRVAFNTIVNYIQLILNVLIGLLTVRFVLQSLGEIDYGIYNLIAGVITLITFISESLSQTSIRFISVGLGQGDAENLRRVFSSCFSLHLYMAILLVVILECIGLFLFDGFLNIPAERIAAAEIVYHCMVATLFLNIVSTPFRAMIIANESLAYISLIGIVEAIGKLIVAVMLLYTSLDRLIVYGILMTVVSFIPFLGLCLFSCVKYKESISLKLAGYSSIAGIIHFAGWTLLDVSGVIANRQGYALMYNKFLGPSANAVFALAGHLEGPMFSVSASVINSIKPQILKSYGQGDKERALRLAMTAGKLGFSMMSLIAIPVLVMLPDVLNIWLGTYPEKTVFYARMMIIACMANQITLGLSTANQAFGKIKTFSIVVSSVRMSALPISIVLLLMGCPGTAAMIVYAVCESLASVSRILVMKKITGLKIRGFLMDVIVDLIIPVFLSLIVCLALCGMVKGVFGLLFAIFCSVLAYTVSIYLFGLTKEEKSSIDFLAVSVKEKLFGKIHRHA